MPCFHPLPLKYPFRELCTILRTLDETNTLKEVSEFSVIPGGRIHSMCCDCGEGMSSAIFLTNGPDMARLKELSKSLKVLRLVPEAVTHADGTEFDYQGLNDFLRCGRDSLQELYLEFVHHQRMSSGCHLLRNLAFKQLLKIQLYDIQFGDLELFSFLSRNKHCLRKVILCSCFMVGEGFLILDEEGNARSASWWWAVLDELRSRGCLREMELYIDSVCQEYPGIAGETLQMEGNPGLEKGMARWKTWTAGGDGFPLQQLPASEGGLIPASGGKIPAEYREWLRSAR